MLRPTLTRILTVVLGVAAAVAVCTPGAIASAAASEVPAERICDRYGLRCERKAATPGHAPKSGAGAGEEATGRRVCTSSEGKTISCSTSDGDWSDQYGCYVKLAADHSAPPPGKNGGAWYECSWLPGTVSGFTSQTFWLDRPPLADPAELARDILARIQLARVGIGITPGPGRTGLIGLPTYLWVNNPGPRTLGPITDSETEGGVTVTLTAKVSRVVWNLGDGTTITCSGAGTPYRDEFGSRPSPTCGHVYKRPSTSLPGGAYRVTATAVWDVAWTGGGQTGVIPFEVTSETSIRMGEAQALN